MKSDTHLTVTMVNKYYSPPHLGGVEVVLRHLSEGLVRYVGARVRALVCNERRERVDETIAGVEIRRLPRHLRISSAPVSVSMPGALLTEARGPERSDVMHFHSPYPWGELSFLMARPDVTSVVLYHSDIVRQERLLAAYRPCLELFLDRVDLIMASSPDIVRHSPFLAPRAHKCRVVPFGLPLERIAMSREAPRRAVVLRAAHTQRRIVLFAGRLVYYKGVEVLVRAMRDVDADLVIVGGGSLEQTLSALVDALGLGGRVTFLPPAPDEELAAWYYAADVLCLPSVARSEAFGLVQIEAHAAGTPVVSTDLPTGVPYANLDRVTGLIVPPGDSAALATALNQLLADDELRARLGAQARARALREFTVPRMVEQTLQVYAEAVDVHARRQGTG